MDKKYFEKGKFLMTKKQQCQWEFQKEILWLWWLMLRYIS